MIHNFKLKEYRLFTSLLVLLGGVTLFVFLLRIDILRLGNSTNNTDQKKEHTRYTLGFVGDIMLDRGVRSAVYSHGGDYNFIFKDIKDTLVSYSILFGNLEGPSSNQGANKGSVYSFRMDPLSLNALKESGFDVLSLANNHSGDWGIDALADTVSEVRKRGIAPVGSGKNISDARGVSRIVFPELSACFIGASEFGKGYLEASTSTAGIALIDEDLFKNVTQAKKDCDLVIVSLHFGDEYKIEPNTYQTSVSKRLLDSGADIVVGHHPHVLQPMTFTNGKVVATSLGNFVFDQPFSKKTMESAILEVDVLNKKIVDSRLVPVYLNQNFQPQLVPVLE